MLQQRMLNVSLLLLLSVLWSGTFLFVKIADHDITPITLMAGRALISLVFIFIVLSAMKKPLYKNVFHIKPQATFIFSGITIAFMWYTIAASETVLTAGMASFLLTTLVIFSWLITTFITKDRPFYWLNCLGIIIAVIGVAVMLGFKNIFYGNANLWYALLYIAGIAVFVIGAIVNKRMCPTIDPFVSTTYNLFYAAIILCIFSLMLEHPFEIHYTAAGITSMLGVGLLSTGIGYLIFFWLVMNVSAVFASMNGYIVPIFGFLMGVFLLHEPYLWHQLIGLGIVFIGIFLTDRKK